MTLKETLYERCKNIISKWSEENIYAISFYVDCNEMNEYKGIINFPEFSVGYNTKRDCGFCSKVSEKRWNYAYWSQNNETVLDQDTPEMADLLLEWYNELNLTNVGIENEEEMFAEDGYTYIGKGPIGYYELLMLVSEIAKDLQNDGTIKEKLGNVPVIVHDLEYPWYVKKATINANPNDEAKEFLKYFKKHLE